MARKVVKERVFSPTGRSLGTFSAVDLESFDLQYMESDEQQENKGGQQGGQSPKKRVPDPVDNNPIRPDSKPSDDTPSSGAGEDPFSKPDQSQGRGKMPDKWDLDGQDLDAGDDLVKNNDEPDPNLMQSNSDGSDDDSADPDAPSASMSDSDSTPERGRQDGQGGQGPSGQSSSSDSGGDEGEGEEGDVDGDGDSQQSQGGQSGSDSQGEQDGQQGGKPGDQSPQRIDPDQMGKGQQSSGSQGQPNSGGQQSQSGQQQGGQQSGKPGQQGDSQSGSSSQGSAGEGGGGSDDGKKISQMLQDDLEDDDSDDESDMDKLIDQMNSKKSEASRSHDAVDNNISAQESQDSRDMPSKKEASQTAKDMLGKAVRQAKEERKNRARSDDSDDSVSEDDILSSVGAGALTSLFVPAMKSDWKNQLEKIFDQAVGFDIVTNPNLINKKIENAPPGREDDIPSIDKVVVLLDCSGSMGAPQFKQAIAHVDTMLKARKMNNTTFHIICWGEDNLKEVLKTYTKVKGRAFKKTIMTMKEKNWGTRIACAFMAASQMVKDPDAVLIFTDAQIFDGWTVKENAICQRFLKKNKKRMIWVLTHDARPERIKEFCEYSYTKKMYIKFKKS